MGSITRESVREALMNGITAEQIIFYLTYHSHPKMKKTLPATVVDQIKLWEKERSRTIQMPGKLFQDFSLQSHYRELVDFAFSAGYVLWRCDERKMFVVSEEGEQDVRDFYVKKIKA